MAGETRHELDESLKGLGPEKDAFGFTEVDEDPEGLLDDDDGADKDKGAKADDEDDDGIVVEEDDEGDGDDDADAADDDADLSADASAQQNAVLEARLKAMEEERRIERETVAEERDAQTKLETISATITALRDKLKKAKEDGETDTELDIIDQLADARSEERTEKARISAAQTKRKEAIENAEKIAKGEISAEQKVHPEAAKWLQKNRWFTDTTNSKHQRARKFTMEADAELIKDGYVPFSPAYFRELNSRIDKRFPGLLKKGATETNGKRDPGGPVSGARNGQGGGSGKVVRITAEDKKEMRVWGLDPKNKMHLKQYARSKRGFI